MWKYYAILSAVFAALTAVFSKAGVKNVDSHVATFIRTMVVLILTFGIVGFSGKLSSIRQISNSSWLFLLLSGVATGLSWLFYWKALQTGELGKVAAIDKFSLVLTIFLGILIFHDSCSWNVIGGGMLILCGTLLMIL